MATFNQFGDKTYKFGFQDAGATSIATAVGIKPQTLSISSEPEFEAEAQDQDGTTKSFVVGPDKFSFTLSGYLTDQAKFKTGKSFTYDGQFYIITGRKRDIANQDFTKGELTGVGFKNIQS